MKATPVPLGQLVAECLDDLASKDYSPATLTGGRSFLNRFVITCNKLTHERSRGRRDECVSTDLDPVYIAKYFTALGGSQGNKNNALVHVRNLVTYAERMNYIRKGGADWLVGSRHAKKTQRTPKHYVDVQDFPALLDLAEQWHPEDRAIMALALFTLCRASEIQCLRLRDIDLMARTITMFRPKTDRWTEVPIGAELELELGIWLDAYAHEIGYTCIASLMEAHPEWYVCPRKEYRPPRKAADGKYGGHSLESFTLAPDQPPPRLENVVKRVLSKMGVEVVQGEGMHTVRRSGARAMLDHLAVTLGQDKALLQVSLMLDHSDPKTTLIYIGVDIERRQLADFIRGGGSMYGDMAAGHEGNVVTLPRHGATEGRQRPEAPLRAPSYQEALEAR